MDEPCLLDIEDILGSVSPPSSPHSVQPKDEKARLRAKRVHQTRRHHPTRPAPAHTAGKNKPAKPSRPKLEKRAKLGQAFVEPTAAERARLVQLLHDLKQQHFNNKAAFKSYLSNAKRRHKVVFKNSVILDVYNELVAAEEFPALPQMVYFLRTKEGRSASGILSITVFTSPYPTFTDEKGNTVRQKFSCEYDCHYCPNHPEQPRSYLPDEPGCRRAAQDRFEPHTQMFDRVGTLQRLGHPVDKLEVLVLGGTWESYPFEYRTAFVRDLFWAANTFFEPPDQRRERRSLPQEQIINQSAKCKIIGLTLETRPDTITAHSVRTLRAFGCTRLQIGIQHVDNRILKKINRRHTIEQGVRAIRMLKDNGFKVDIHLMPDLPGSSFETDLDMFKALLGVRSRRLTRRGTEVVLAHPELSVDQWKVYPTAVTPWTVIEKWYKQGLYKPYGGDGSQHSQQLLELIVWLKTRVFPWIRLNRIVRDIPGTDIIGGNGNTNMRQHVLKTMRERGLRCRCIRCREVGLQHRQHQIQQGQVKGGTINTGGGGAISENSFDRQHAELVVRSFGASMGREFFISFESSDEARSVLFGFLRLRLKPERAHGGLSEFAAHNACDAHDSKVANGDTEDAKRQQLYTEQFDCAERAEPSRHQRSDKEEDREDREDSAGDSNQINLSAFDVLENAALVRELHVYGMLQPTYRSTREDHSTNRSAQHAGFGRRLLQHAEEIAWRLGRQRVAVIAGIGTRDYYAKWGYTLRDSYMVKERPVLWRLQQLQPPNWSGVAVLLAFVLWWVMQMQT